MRAQSRMIGWRVLQILLVVILIGGLPPAPAAAAPPSQTFGGDPLNAFPALFPELLTLPAPAWVREGQRVSYYVQSASIPENQDEGGSAGAGYLQHDIVAVSQENVVVSSSYYVDTGNGVTPGGVFGASFLPGYGDFWLNPAVLEGAEAVANDDLIVVHMPTTIAGQRYDAVRFEYRSGAAVTISTFDVKTGLLIYYRHTVGDDFAAPRQSSEIYLLGRRQIRLPWRATKAPSWVRKGSAIHYDGARSIYVAGSPSSQLPESASVDVKVAQGRWSAFQVTSYLMGTASGVSDRVTGVSQLTGAIWLPAEALRANLRRPLLDRDPITGVEVSYVRNPDQTITISEEGTLFRIDNTYDRRTGKLLATRIEIQTGLAVQVIELFLARS